METPKNQNRTLLNMSNIQIGKMYLAKTYGDRLYTYLPIKKEDERYGFYAKQFNLNGIEEYIFVLVVEIIRPNIIKIIYKNNILYIHHVDLKEI